ncbi:MAG: VOC family protein [Granulosicoccaceae bacterium]
MPRTKAPRSQPLIAVNDVLASSVWYAKLLNVRLHSDTEEDTHGNSYNRLSKGNQIIMQLHGWDADGHPNMISKTDTVVGHGVVLWFEVDEFNETVSRAKEIGAISLEEPSKKPYAHHLEFWIADPNGYVVGIASKPEL